FFAQVVFNRTSNRLPSRTNSGAAAQHEETLHLTKRASVAFELPLREHHSKRGVLCNISVWHSLRSWRLSLRSASARLLPRAPSYSATLASSAAWGPRADREEVKSNRPTTSS